MYDEELSVSDEAYAIEQSEAFLKYLQQHDDEKQLFFQAVLDLLVELGRERQFFFTPDAIEKVAAIKYKVDNVWHPPR